jgi:dCMP deaminase
LREEKGIPSGEKIEICRAVHAEQMAIDSAAETGASVKGATMYVNAEPCLFCARQIAGLGIDTLVVLKGGYGKTHGLNIVQRAGIRIREITL